jgi:hypothetical protein
MRTLKWIGAIFLTFLCLVYGVMLMQGGPNRGGILFLLILCGLGAYALWRSMEKEDLAVEEHEQSQEELAQLQHEVIALAFDHDGVLTVTDVVADLNYTIKLAEQVLSSLEDGVRITSNVTDEGIIVYEFREVIHRKNRLAKPRD